MRGLHVSTLNDGALMLTKKKHAALQEIKWQSLLADRPAAGANSIGDNHGQEANGKLRNGTISGHRLGNPTVLDIDLLGHEDSATARCCVSVAARVREIRCRAE